MYRKVKSCVKSLNSFFSANFEYVIGLSQVEVMSPIMFSRFIEDLELFLKEDYFIIIYWWYGFFIRLSRGVTKPVRYCIYYCEKWGINVNVYKTQIVVFRERGGLLPGRITETILRLSISLTILATFLIILVASIWTKNT